MAGEPRRVDAMHRRSAQACPLRNSSPNASSPRDVLGTLMLGMVGEELVRRALKAMQPEASEPWMSQALMTSVRGALDRPWVLDMDATVKRLYGRQEGAEVGYNPHKPGRPSHVLHT